MIFIGKLGSGVLFPALDCVSGKSCATVQDMMHNYLPVRPEDFGKVMVWSFIAGVSERMVPDLLQSLVTKHGKGEEK